MYYDDWEYEKLLLTSKYEFIIFLAKKEKVGDGTLRPRAATAQLDETYAPSLILAHLLHYVKTWRHAHNRMFIKYYNAVI